MTLKRLFRSLMLALTLVAVQSPSVQAAPEATPTTNAVAQNPAQHPTPGTESETLRYAAREAASPDAKKFQGGDVIVISAGALVVILLVLLVVVVIF